MAIVVADDSLQSARALNVDRVASANSNLCSSLIILVSNYN